jgi:hypothetical protein
MNEVTTNLFRSTYRTLSDLEKDHMLQLKETASQLLAYINMVPDSRCRAMATASLEESFMWATKGITG